MAVLSPSPPPTSSHRLTTNTKTVPIHQGDEIYTFVHDVTGTHRFGGRLGSEYNHPSPIPSLTCALRTLTSRTHAHLPIYLPSYLPNDINIYVCVCMPLLDFQCPEHTPANPSDHPYTSEN